MKKLIYLLFLVMMVNGCANPSYFKKDMNFMPVNWKRVAVLPFSGDVRFVQEGTDTFSLHLLGQNDFEVLSPSTIEYAINQVVAVQDSNTSFTVMQVQKIGSLVNADVIVVGNVTSYNNGMTLNGFATVKLIDVKSGKIIAASHKDSGLLFGFSEHQGVVKAVERTAKDILKALKEFAEKNTIVEPKVEKVEDEINT